MEGERKITPKSESAIIIEELDKFIDSPKYKKILELMNNINPFETCFVCGNWCSKEHMICIDCYISKGEH